MLKSGLTKIVRSFLIDFIHYDGISFYLLLRYFRYINPFHLNLFYFIGFKLFLIQLDFIFIRV